MEHSSVNFIYKSQSLVPMVLSFSMWGWELVRHWLKSACKEVSPIFLRREGAQCHVILSTTLLELLDLITLKMAQLLKREANPSAHQGEADKQSGFLLSEHISL